MAKTILAIDFFFPLLYLKIKREKIEVPMIRVTKPR